MANFTKMKLWLLTMLLLVGSVVWGQTTFTWNFGTTSGNASPSSGSLTNLTVGNISIGNTLGTVTMLSTTSASGTGFSGQFNAGNAARTGALNIGSSGSAYFEFTLTPATGYAISLSTISFGSRGTGTAPKAYTLRSSADSYISDIATGTLLTNSTWAAKSNTDLTFSSSSGNAITFRLYGYDGEGSPGSNTINWRIDDLSIVVSLSELASTPTITAPSPTSLSGFSTITGTASSSQTFTVGGSNLTADLVVTAPTNYEVRESGIGSFGSSVSFTPSTGTVASKTIEVRIAASAGVGSPSGNVVCSSTDATSQNVAVSGTVSAPPTPTITLTPATLTGFNYVHGAGPSAEQSFTLSGANLTHDISLTAPSNYEISKTSSTGFAASLDFAQTGGDVSSQTVYVRLKANLSVGDYNSEVITASSTGADNKTVTVSGTVSAPPSPEPSAHVTGFDAVENGQNAIYVAWADVEDVNVVGYLIKASTSFEAIVAPVDGTPETNSTLVKNVVQGEGTVEFTGLAAGTPYYFKIWPYSNSGASIDYKTDGSVPEASATTVAPALPNVIITEVYGGGGNSGATFKNDFIELYNTTESPVDISGWSVQYFPATTVGTATNANINVIPAASVIPAKSHFLIQQAAGTGGSVDLFEPNVIGTIAMAASNGKVILFTTNTAQTITSDISSVTGNSNFKDYLPYGASTPVWGTEMSATANATSATRKKVSGEYVYTQNVGNDFEVVTPTPQNSGKYRTTGNGDWNNVATWEFTDNGTWSPATVVPANTTSPVIVNANDELIISTNVSVSSATLAPQGKLTVNSGQTLTVSGNLTLESNAAGTATLVDNGTISVTGTITAQQYLAGSRNWYVASPVSNANALGGGFEYWEYNEPDGSSATENWTVVSASTPLVPGRGYVVKPSAETTYAFSTTTGTLNTGNVTVPLTRTVGVTKEGFNLVGNPYPSYLNLNDLLTGDIETSYWMRGRNSDNTAWVFDSFNKEGNVGTNNSGKAVTTYVPPMQSFWVRVKTGVASTNLVFDNTMRAHIDNASNRFRAPQNSPLIRLEMSNGTAADQTVLYANNNAVDAVDKYDTHKMLNNSTFVPDIYSVVGNQKLAINGLSTLPLNVEMPLGILVKEAGSFSIRASEVRAIDADIVLIDKLNGNAEWLLNGGAEYQFASSTTTHAERFALVLRAPGTTTGECCNDILAAQTMVFVDAFKNININCAMAVNKNAKVAVYNAVGQMLTQRNLENGSASIAVTSKGVYLVELNVDGLRTTKRVIVK